MASGRRCFYDEQWTQTIDDLFIRILEVYAREYEEIKIHNSWLPEICRTGINRVRNKNFVMEEDIVKRFYNLEDRYHTWNCIISRDDVVYDMETNTVAAKRNVWDKICQNYEYGMVYREGNEHKFFELAGIFGPQATTRRDLGSGTQYQVNNLSTMQIAIADYDNMKKERELFQSYPHIIPRTIPPSNGMYPGGQYCPRPMINERNFTPSFQPGSSRNSSIDADSKGKHFNNF